MNILRHGDLLPYQIEELPKEAIEIENFNGVLAYGEKTGHRHQLKSKVKAYTLNQDTIISLDQDTELSHEEHKTIILPRGFYLIKKQRERDPFLENIRSVVD